MATPSIFTTVINGYLPEPHASLLNGIIFGTPLKTSRLFYDQLRIVGLLHIVVLSGMNITILATIIGTVTRFFSKSISVLLTILTIILFILFVGPQASIIRAGLMGIFTLVAMLFGRKDIALYSLFLSGIFIAIFWPQWLSTISFQLSYGATLGIILFGQTKSTSELWKELKITLAAQVLTVPIILHYFRQISLISPLANLLIAPVIPPLMIFGFLTAILGKIHFALGLLPAYISYGLLSCMVIVVQWLAKIPFASISF